MQLKASAPGSLMILGEYAVLHGHPALVAAINQSITVTLTPRNDEHIEIHSDLHGVYSTSLSSLIIEKPFHFVLTAIKFYRSQLKFGFNLKIESQFTDQMGLGSSAAVTVATLAAIATWLNIKMTPIRLLRDGRQVVREAQDGLGSGADVAASVYGGLVHYQAQPLFAESLPQLYPLTTWYSGFKTKTIDAIARVNQHFSSRVSLYRSIIQSIGECAKQGVQYAQEGEWAKLGEVMTIQQGMMASLGVSMPRLNEMVYALHALPSILGAKISGAGLGDCVIGLGENNNLVFKQDGVKSLPLAMTRTGVTCEKI